MARFPFYIEMKGRPVIVCGGGAVALRKVRILAEFGADILVISPKIHQELAEMAAQGAITWDCRCILADQAEQFHVLDSAFLVICATEDRELNRSLAGYCRKKGLWVDCADSARDSSCLFPSIVRRGEIVIGISTSGGVPALTRHLRSRIEAIVPAWYGELEQKLRAAREQLKQTDWTPQEKRNCLRAMIEESERRKNNQREGKKNENRDKEKPAGSHSDEAGR